MVLFRYDLSLETRGRHVASSIWPKHILATYIQSYEGSSGTQGVYNQ